MSLTSALSIAQSALRNASRQTSIISRNVTDASNSDYVRRSAALSSAASGARITEIRRATNEVLFRQNLFATSSWQGQSAVSTGLDTLQLMVNGVDNATAPATTIGNLQEALQLYSATPSNKTLGESAMEAAREVVRTLNSGTSTVQSFRVDMDEEIADAVADLNLLLADFEAANVEVINGTRAGRDVSDAFDRRDGLLKKISEYVPISTATRADNDLVITTGDGVTLFETVARPVSFEPNAAYAAGLTGNAVYIDGVPLDPGAGGNTSASGSIAARLQLRDDVAVKMQSQLDEIARGLVTAFRETDPNGGQPDAAGLFTWSGGPGVPVDGTLVNGLAGSIRLNPAVDPQQGGDVTLLRDGGINGGDYVHNTEGGASYADLILSYSERLDAPMNFDPAAGLNDTRSISDFSTDAVGWLEALRQDATNGAESKEALAVHTATALGHATGVDVDEEMSLLLELEHAYEASARLLSVIDEMLATLIEATR